MALSAFANLPGKRGAHVTGFWRRVLKSVRARQVTRVLLLAKSSSAAACNARLNAEIVRLSPLTIDAARSVYRTVRRSATASGDP